MMADFFNFRSVDYMNYPLLMCRQTLDNNGEQFCGFRSMSRSVIACRSGSTAAPTSKWKKMENQEHLILLEDEVFGKVAKVAKRAAARP